jgi:hypothetical protein
MSAQAGKRVGRVGQHAPVGQRLRIAVEQAASDDPRQRIRAMFGIQESPAPMSRFRAWRAARARAHASQPGGLDQAWIRDELNRMCSAYEAAFGDERRPTR